MKKYEQYKDSGVEWIGITSTRDGKVPVGWGVKRLKYLVTINDDVIPEKTDDEVIINYVDISSVDFKLGIFRTESFNFGEAPSRARRLVKEGDVIVSTVRTYLKSIAPVTKTYENAVVSTGFAVVRSTLYDSQFLSFLFSSEGIVEEIVSRSKGVSYPAINSSEIGLISAPFPPLPEQQTIATYLTHKTNQLDRTIAQRRTLIALLEEERAAVINEAVTRGLDPDVAMKDSGVEWLGAVPEHWGATKLKYVGSIKYGLGQPPRQKEGGLPLIRATNVFRGKISADKLIFVDPEDVPYDRDPVLQEDDIIVVRSGAYTADSARIPIEYEGAITGYDMVFRPLNINARFIAFGLLSSYILYNQLYMHRLRAAQPHLNAEELGETLILLPPKKEQKLIVSHIESEIHRLDTELARLTQEITLLEEYRQSLITEVVTGVVDVRGWQKTEV